MSGQGTGLPARVMKTCIAGLLLAGAAGHAAADYVTLSKRDGNHNVLGKEPAIRVGKAAIVRVLTHTPARKELTANHFLLACDGSWMTDNFAYSSMPAESADFAAIERHSVANLPEVIETVHNLTMQDRDGSYDGPVLKKHIRRLCSRARPAPPDMLVPLGSTSVFTNQLLVFSIIAKPAQAKGNRVRAWFRTTFYSQVQPPSGQPEPGVPTGEYWMTLKEVDCAKPQVAQLEHVVHLPAGTTRTTCPEGCMIPVKADTMGDEERKMACRLFGKSATPLPL